MKIQYAMVTSTGRLRMRASAAVDRTGADASLLAAMATTSEAGSRVMVEVDVRMERSRLGKVARTLDLFSFCFFMADTSSASAFAPFSPSSREPSEVGGSCEEDGPPPITTCGLGAESEL